MLRSKSASFVLALAMPLAAIAVPAISPGEARADAPAATAPVPRSAFSAPFQRYLLAPNGKPMGLMLADGSVVLTPRHAMHRDAPMLQAGTKLDVEGFVRQTPTGTIVQRAVVRTGGTVVADGTKARRHAHRGEGKEEHAGKHHQELKPVSGAGQIAAMVSDAKGHVHAIVLADGTTASGHGLGALGLKVGDRVAVAGQGGVYPLGKALRVEKITLPNGQVRDMPKRIPAQAQPGDGPV